MKIHKDDTVKIIIGKDRGKSGKVTDVNIKTGLIVVAGLNLFKKHQRPRKQGEKGEIINVPRPISSSNVRLVCPSCRKITRVGYRFEGAADNPRKIRYCKKCRSPI